MGALGILGGLGGLFGGGSAKRQAQAAAKQAQATATGEGAAASAERAMTMPFFAQEMSAKHEFTPQQLSELMTTGESGAGAAAGTEQAKLAEEAARTHTGLSLGKSLDEMSRERMQTAAGLGEKVAAEDVMGAQQLRQAGARGMAGLMGTDVAAQMKAMGIETGDIQAQTEAAQEMAQAGTSAGKSLAGAVTPFTPYGATADEGGDFDDFEDLRKAAMKS